jgi:hypothetical protein
MNMKSTLKVAALAIVAGAGLGGCAVVPYAERPVYVAPAPAYYAAPTVVVRPAYRPYYYGSYYGPHRRHWR